MSMTQMCPSCWSCEERDMMRPHHAVPWSQPHIALLTVSNRTTRNMAWRKWVTPRHQCNRHCLCAQERGGFLWRVCSRSNIPANNPRMRQRTWLNWAGKFHDGYGLDKTDFHSRIIREGARVAPIAGEVGNRPHDSTPPAGYPRIMDIQMHPCANK